MKIRLTNNRTGEFYTMSYPWTVISEIVDNLDMITDDGFIDFECAVCKGWNDTIEVEFHVGDMDMLKLTALFIYCVLRNDEVVNNVIISNSSSHDLLYNMIAYHGTTLFGLETSVEDILISNGYISRDVIDLIDLKKAKKKYHIDDEYIITPFGSLHKRLSLNNDVFTWEDLMVKSDNDEPIISRISPYDYDEIITEIERL